MSTHNLGGGEKKVPDAWVELSHSNLKFDTEEVTGWKIFLVFPVGKGQLLCLGSECQAAGFFESRIGLEGGLALQSTFSGFQVP